MASNFLKNSKRLQKERAGRYANIIRILRRDASIFCFISTYLFRSDDLSKSSMDVKRKMKMRYLRIKESFAMPNIETIFRESNLLPEATTYLAENPQISSLQVS
jgi:hypothetical protein